MPLQQRSNRYRISQDHDLGFTTYIPFQLLRRSLRAFPAFEDRNYRLYFCGQLISLIGTWLQSIAQGWLVLELTHSAFWVGAVFAIGGLPILLFSLFGGVLVDRLPTKRVLYYTQLIPLVLALILGFLTIAHRATLVNISALAFLLGMVNALDAPARQVFTSEMMNRKRLASAITLNAATFNLSRVLGPSVAGILIATVGLGGTFLINAASFLAVLVSLLLIRFPEPPTIAAHPPHLTAVKEGLRYAFRNPGIRMLMLAAGATSIFGWSYVSILPAITQQIFHQQAAGLGYLHTAAGLGALVSVILMSIFLNRMGTRYFIVGGNALLAVSLFVFSFTTRFAIGLAIMFCAGLALLAQSSTTNTAIQHNIPDAIRGRVMSIYVLMFRGMAPVGGFIIGYLADQWGIQLAIRFSAAATLTCAALLFSHRRNIPRLH